MGSALLKEGRIALAVGFLGFFLQEAYVHLAKLMMSFSCCHSSGVF